MMAAIFWAVRFFSNGLGVGDPRQRDLGAPINRGAVILHDMTPLPERHDPNVHSPQDGYGGRGILGSKDRDTDLASRFAKVIGYSDPLPLSPPSPMTGLTRQSRPGDPAEYGTDPQHGNGVRVFGGSAPSRSAVGDAIAALQADNIRLRPAITGLENRLAEQQPMLNAILKKRAARPAVRRKTARRRVSAKKVSTPERKYIGGRSKNASRTDARRAAADARPRPGRVTPSSAFQFDQ
jgi:hypothetical protein